MGAFLLHLEDVKESPRSFRLTCDAATWPLIAEAVREPETHYLEAPALELEGHRLGLRLLFRGRLVGALELHCGRCLEPFRFPLDEVVELLLEPARAGHGPAFDRLELDPDDPGLGRYGGDVLDFTPVVVETLALAWPMKPLCAEGCLGLCPVCGRNRNREGCSCGEGERAKPFGELGKLLEQARRQGR